MRELYLQVHDSLSDEDQAVEAIAECSRLSAALAVFLMRRPAAKAHAASAIADMEVMCERLRLIVGEELVDLEKLEVLANLQERLKNPGAAALARRPVS